MIEIAVLIACHNRKHKTVKCLQKLYSQNNTENIKFKVFLVDDGSTDGTEQTIKQLFPNIIIIKGNGNLFWAKSMALAWKECLQTEEKFDYFLWLNDDTYLYDTALSELIKTQIDKTEIVIGSVCDPITKFKNYGGSRFKNRFLRPFKGELVQVNGTPQKIDTFNGNVVLVPNSVCNDIGIIDNYFEHGYADLEYSLRARKNNIIILLTSNHIGECELNNLNSEKNFSLTLSQKISNIFGRKATPPKSWFKICYMYGGILWPIHFFIGYIKSIISVLFKHNYFNKN